MAWRILKMFAAYLLERKSYCLGQVTSKGLEFDFRLKEGITPTRNAIDLLRYLGFPQTIVERAAQQVP